MKNKIKKVINALFKWFGYIPLNEMLVINITEQMYDIQELKTARVGLRMDEIQVYDSVSYTDCIKQEMMNELFKTAIGFMEFTENVSYPYGKVIEAKLYVCKKK